MQVPEDSGLLSRAIRKAEELREAYERRAAYKRWFAADGLVPFVMEAVKWRDEHDAQNPIKPPPDEEYIRVILEALRTEETLVIVKSRQVMVSWCAYSAMVWELLRRAGTRIALVPQTEEDGQRHIADRIVDTIWMNLPEWLKAAYRIERVEGIFRIVERAGKPWDSWLTSYAKGEHKLRNFTHSIVLWDEMGAQPLAHRTWRAAVPTAGSRGEHAGRLICISTPVPYSKHHELCGPDIVGVAAQVARGELAPFELDIAA